MIDLKRELSHYSPINLENILKMGKEISEDTRNSILFYNNALESLRTDSEDIAIIELRKAISLNPDFYEAINLLGVCYTYLKDYRKAKEMFERVARAENNGVKAYNYLSNIRKEETKESATKTEKEKKADRREQLGTTEKKKRIKEIRTREKKDEPMRHDTIKMDAARTEGFRFNGFVGFGKGKKGMGREIVKYLTGIIIGLILAFLIGIPGITKQDKDDTLINKDQYNDSITAEDDIYIKLEEKYNQLNKEYEKLKKDYEIALKDKDYYKSVLKLYETEDYYKAQEFEEAADILVTVKGIEFDGVEKEKYNSLYKAIIPRASDIVYSQAYNLFQSGNFKESVTKYLKILDYNEDYGKTDIVLYYAGKCYIELNDNERAREMFVATIERFPNSEYARYSQGRLDSITDKEPNSFGSDQD